MVDIHQVAIQQRDATRLQHLRTCFLPRDAPLYCPCSDLSVPLALLLERRLPLTRYDHHQILFHLLFTMVKPTPSNDRVSPEELYNVLCESASQDPVKMRIASTRLKDMLDQPGSWNLLQEIASQKSVPLPVRQLSALQFKNRALDHWRSRRYATYTLFAADFEGSSAHTWLFADS